MVKTLVSAAQNNPSWSCITVDVAEETFRQHLLAMEKENADLRLAHSQLRCNMSDKDSELQEMKKRFADIEKVNETYRQKIILYEEERHELEREVFLLEVKPFLRVFGMLTGIHFYLCTNYKTCFA
jgi:hypothetical protein